MFYRIYPPLKKNYDANDKEEIAAKIEQFHLTKFRFYFNEKENY